MSMRDYQRDMDLVLQQMMDREEQALLARFREACPDADEGDGPELLKVIVDQAIKEGLRGAAAVTWAMALFGKFLDLGYFKANGDVNEDA